MKRPVRLGVLFSGRGSNLEALIRACREGCLKGVAEVVVAATQKPGAGGLELAKRWGVATCVVEPMKGEAREAFDARMVAALATRGVEWVALAGYMRLVSPGFLAAFPNRVVNIHPADTAKHQGLHGYEWAFEQRLPETFITVHRVDAGLDTGAVLARERVDLAGAETLDEVVKRGLAVEHRLYAETLRKTLTEESPCVE